MKIRMMAAAPRARSTASASSRPRRLLTGVLEPRRDGLHHRRHQGRSPTPRSATRSPTTGSPADKLLPGFKPSVPVVFCGLFPTDAAEFETSARQPGQAAPQRRQLPFRGGDSAALGFGFRCGFLGLLHLEIIQERLEREFDLDLITTAPSVVYKIHMTDGSVIELHNPADMPDPDPHHQDRGAVDQGHDHGAGRVSRQRAVSSAPTGAASRSS